MVQLVTSGAGQSLHHKIAARIAANCFVRVE